MINPSVPGSGHIDPREAELASLREQLRQQAALAELHRRVGEITELGALLGLLGEEVRRAGVFDGYLIVLPDAEQQHLHCQYVDLPAGFKSVESAYQDIKFPLSEGGAIAVACLGNAPAFVDAAGIAAEPELVRALWERWLISELTVLPIALDGRARAALIGFVQKGRTDRQRLDALRGRLPVFAGPIRSAAYVSGLMKLEAGIRAAAVERKRFLDMVRHVTDLTDVEQLFEVIAREFLEWLPFDLCSVAVRVGDRLRVATHVTLQARFAELAKRLDEFCAVTPFKLEIADGVLAAAFLNNRQVFIPDAMKLRHLPMADKDRRLLEMMETPRSILYLPIRHQDRPIGMISLFTLTESVQPTDSERQLSELVCDVIGTAIANASLYSTVERQRHEIEQTLNELTRTQARLREAEAAKLQALLQSKEAAEASAVAKSAFIANTSHEIRTPLTAIIGFVECLAETAEPGSQAQQWTGIILRNSRHLLGLIDDVLDVSKLEAGKIALEPLETDPLELVGDLQSLFDMLSKSKRLEFGVDYRFPLPGRIVCDPTRLRQVLLNLLNNAIKFTERGRVELAMAYQAQTRRLTFRVSDTGIGMPEAVLQKIFEPFTQADVSTSRRFGGTGLGLKIAADLVQLMGGELRVSSRPGEGSRFEFSIPAGLEAVALVERLPERGRNLPTHAEERARLAGTVLIADDGIDNRRLVELYVTSTGARVTTVADGEEAVRAVLNGRYDLVLLDIQMPVLNGLEAVRILRERHFAGPIYALTANVGAQAVDAYRRAGFDGCLAKPIDRAAFFQLLRDRLPGAETEAEAELDIAELEREFARRLPDYVRQLLADFDAGDWARVSDQAHRLKGSAGGLGWPDLTVAADAVESAARRRLTDPAVQALLERAVAELRERAAIPAASA